MNSMPLGPIPDTALFLDGFSYMTILLGLTSVIVVFGTTLWTLARVTRERVPLLCPVHSQPVGVVFRLGLDGRRADVVRCSVFGNCPPTCGRMCLQRSRAVHAGRRRS